MNTTTHRISFAERLGHWLGHGWRAYARGEQRVLARFVSHGVPATVAAMALWVVKLGLFVALLYIAFWLALLLVFTVVAAWVARNADWDESQPEWRYGVSGYGLYRGDIRIDIGDSCEDE